MSKDNTNYNETEIDAQAKQIVGLLDSNAQRLSMRTLKKLEDARIGAVKTHQDGQGTAVNSDGTLSWVSWIDHHRFAFAGLVLAAMIGSFVMMQNFSSNETSDAFLLGADLPPEAFVDRGFEPSLNNHANI